MKPPSARICLALMVSLLLHVALLAGRLPVAAPEQPPRLEARLLIPEAKPQPEVAPDPEVFEKNTLAPEVRQAEPPARPKASTAPPSRLKTNDEQRALRKLSEHILYPQAAIDAGHEGTVHLLLKLDTHGTILQASVAASSGHPELDHAALQSALRAGRLNAGGRAEFILPITFRLQ